VDVATVDLWRIGAGRAGDGLPGAVRTAWSPVRAASRCDCRS
jgi:hypothetical protein